MKRDQLSFSTTWDGFKTDAEAKKARDDKYRELKKQGIKCRRWVLKNQLLNYEGYDKPCHKICDVYMLNIEY